MGVAGGAVSDSLLCCLLDLFTNTLRSFHQSKVRLPTVQALESPWSYHLLDLSTYSSIACITGSPTAATSLVSRISSLQLILLGEEVRLGEELWAVQSTMFTTPERRRVFPHKEAGKHLSFHMAESSLLPFKSEGHRWLQVLLLRKSRRGIRFFCKDLCQGVRDVGSGMKLRPAMCL